MDKHGVPGIYNALMSTIGNEIGSGEVRFIQDAGTKTEGIPYLDKNTNKLYLCMTTTTSTNNDSNFILFNLKELLVEQQKIGDNTWVELGRSGDLTSSAVSGDYSFPIANANNYRYICYMIREAPKSIMSQFIFPTEIAKSHTVKVPMDSIDDLLATYYRKIHLDNLKITQDGNICTYTLRILDGGNEIDGNNGVIVFGICKR